MANPKTASVDVPRPTARNGWVRKSDLDEFLGRSLPIPTQIVSNEEFVPLEQTREQKLVEHRLLALAGDAARRSGIGRREFLRSSAGMAAAFSALNAVFGEVFRVDAAELYEPAAAAEARKYFIFDVQTHHVAAGRQIPSLMDFRREGRNWNEALRGREPRMEDVYLENYIKEIFLDSETDMVVISGFPSTMDHTNILPPDQMVKTRSWLNRLTGSRRVVSHGLMSPDLGKQNTESMHVQAEKLKIEAWKSYTGVPLAPGSKGWWMDDEKLTYPSLEYSRKIGVKNICVHKGLPLEGFNVEHCHPRDIIKASRDFPDLNFLIYHSGFKSVADALPVAAKGFPKDSYIPWTSDLCRARKQNPHMTNVYMELGSTFGMIAITQPVLCAHVLGMILDAFSPDRVLWGTDSVWWGSPQWQIEALRRMEMPRLLQDRFGWKPLTPEVKAKIFGLNAARVYGVDPKARLNAMPQDYIERLRGLARDAAYHAPANTQYGWVRAS